MMSVLPPAQVTEIHRLMTEAAARYNQGDFREAGQLCQRVLELFPDFPQALHLSGLCQKDQGEWDAASVALLRAAKLSPNEAQIYHDLGDVYSKQGRWLEAAQAYLRAIELRPGYPDSYVNLGAVYENISDHEQAERAYRRALELNPQLAAAAASLAAMCESGNRLQEAAQYVECALREDVNDPVANLTQAQLDFRAGKHTEAGQRLEALLQRPLAARNRALALARLGTIYETFTEYERAFKAFQASKQALNVGDALASGPGVYTLDAAQRISGHLPALMAEVHTDKPDPVPAPVFLVGFPRSGTTLLDQILSSHPRLWVLEEKENLRDLLRDFVTTDSGLERLAKLASTGLDEYRKKYWARVAESRPESVSDKIFVDKLPLNTVFMPLIARLFPGARFIYAVRDPRDVVLSCFMRAFGMNEAMRNFLTLEGAARYYAAVMRVGIDATQKLGKSVHVIRYETLISDPESESRRLCEFLDLGWEAGMLHFQETARKRRINTPSYHQVVQPLYTSSRERWRRYEKHLHPVLPLLQPFIEYFGYS
ncbi:MAG: tetratricopeptide repeat-containing sulfotransferase family protein [Gammaproteobacteria bacterium]